MKINNDLEAQVEKSLENPQIASFSDVIAEAFPEDAASLISKIKRRLASLLYEHQHDSEDLREDSWYYILPSIAIYEVLKNHAGKEKALELFRKIYFKTAYECKDFLKNKLQDEDFLKIFPHDFVQTVRSENSVWKSEIISDNENGSEFRIYTCPFRDFCAAYNVPEIATIFCECDDIMYSDLHPKIRWERNGTLARGNAYCDFRIVRC